jgi:hypothetical protein
VLVDQEAEKSDSDAPWLVNLRYCKYLSLTDISYLGIPYSTRIYCKNTWIVLKLDLIKFLNLIISKYFPSGNTNDSKLTVSLDNSFHFSFQTNHHLDLNPKDF